MDHQSVKLCESVLKVSDDYRDPMTQQIMLDPVTTCDGEVYEREAIEKWLQNHNTSPRSNEVLDNKKLIANRTILRLINALLDENPQLRESDEIYFSEKVFTAFKKALKNNDWDQVDALLHKDRRLLTKPLDDDKTLLSYVLENGSLEFLQKIFKKLGDKISTLPEIQNNKIFELFKKLIQENKVKNAKVLAVALNWGKDHYTELMLSAIEQADKALLTFSVECNANVNGINQQGETALLLAQKHSDRELFEFLMSKGADLNFQDHKGNTLLHHAVSNGSKTDIEYLLAKKIAIELLNKQGQRAIDLIINDLTSDVAFEIAELLIKAGARVDDPERDNIPALVRAVQNSNIYLLKILLKGRVDLTIKDTSGDNLLFQALNKNQLEIAALLIDAGINLHECDHAGSSSVLKVLQTGSTLLVNLMLGRGINLTAAVDKKGNTPLHIALEQGHQEMVKILSQRGANLHALNADKCTPIDLAQANGHYQLVRFIEEQHEALKFEPIFDKFVRPLQQEIADIKVKLERLEYKTNMQADTRRRKIIDTALWLDDSNSLDLREGSVDDPTPTPIEQIIEVIKKDPFLRELGCDCTGGELVEGVLSFRDMSNEEGFNYNFKSDFVQGGKKLLNNSTSKIFSLVNGSYLPVPRKDYYVPTVAPQGIRQRFMDDDFIGVVSPNGGWQAMIEHRKIRINSGSGNCLATLEGHAEDINALLVLPNGNLASGSDDKTIRIWDIERGRCLATLEGHTGRINALFVLPNGNLASGSYDKTIRIWDIERGRCLATLEGHIGYIIKLVVLPNGNLASGSYDKTIRIWDIERGRCLATLEGHTQFITSLFVLPNGNLASGSYDNTIRIWDIERGRCLATLEGHTRSINALLVLPNGNLASGSDDKTIRIWDIERGRCLATLERFIKELERVSLIVLPNGDLACEGLSKIGYNTGIEILDVKRSVFKKTIQLPFGFCFNEYVMALYSADGCVKLMQADHVYLGFRASLQTGYLNWYQKGHDQILLVFLLENLPDIDDVEELCDRARILAHCEMFFKIIFFRTPLDLNLNLVAKTLEITSNEIERINEVVKLLEALATHPLDLEKQEYPTHHVPLQFFKEVPGDSFEVPGKDGQKRRQTALFQCQR